MKGGTPEKRNPDFDKLLSAEYLQSICLVIFFLVALMMNLYFVQKGWGNRLLDHHSFRQTQTAISTYYLLKDGLTINYITPLLGAPWAIPLEFPTYQLIVAVFVKLTGMPLNQAGRFVSLTFFYLCFVPLFLLFRMLKMKEISILAIFSFILASPHYSFWSRTFMVESTALFFSLTALFFSAKALSEWKAGYVAGGILCGSLSALTKITTGSVFLFALAIIIVVHWFFIEERRKYTVPVIGRYLLYVILLLGVPMLSAIAWTKHADSVKMLNPLAAGITSKALKSWTFGTIEQKLSPGTWKQIFYNSKPVIGSGYLWLLLPFAFLKGRYHFAAVVSLLSFLVGPMVFTNLYFRHDYYFYAVGVFLLTLLGISVVSLLEGQRFRLVGLLLVPVILVVMYSEYMRYFDPWHGIAGSNVNDVFYGVIEKYTSEDDVLLIYGQDWSAATPYHVQRKAIMDTKGRPLDDESMQKAVANIGREKITGMVVCGRYFFDNRFARERVEFFDFNPRSLVALTMGGWCKIYLKKGPQ